MSFLLCAALAAIIVANCHRASSSAKTVITLDPTTTYQTIVGWEASAQSGQTDSLAFPKYKDQLFEQTVNDLGINRIRVEIRSGVEHPIDYFSQYLNGQIDRTKWKQHWYEVINDNDDPLVTNSYGFQFSELDYKVGAVVEPLKQGLEARGEKLYVNLNVVDFECCRGRSNLRHQERPEEYAEFVLAAFTHLKRKYGWVPDAVEVILEPDNAKWSGTEIGRIIVTTGERLQASGFTPEFIAPSNANMAKAISWFDEIVQVPGVLKYLSEFSYHRYGGVSDANLRAIAGRAIQYKIKTSMLEHIGSGHEDLHKDLKLGRVSAWQQYTLAYPTKDNGAQYYFIEGDDPAIKLVIGSRTKFLRQYFKYIRGDAIRIDAKTNNDNYDPIAFVNADGKYVVVVKASRGGSFSIQGLAPSTYGIKYTTPTQYDVDEPDVTIGSDESLTAKIPEPGVVTIYARGQGKV
jgi:hypothetical protein